MKIIRRFVEPMLAGFLAIGAVLLTAKPAKAVNEWFNCRPTSVFEYNGQVQVSCSNSQSGTSWVAININDHPSAKVARFVSLASTALMTGRQFRVFLVDMPGCGFGGCRLATAWGLHTF